MPSWFSSLKDSCYENCSAGRRGGVLGGEFEPLDSKCFSRFLCYFVQFLKKEKKKKATFDLTRVERSTTGAQ